MIELWDGYAITTDEYQFILGKPVMRTHKARDKEEMHIDNATYHATLAQALASFHRLQMRESIRDNQQTLAQAIAASAQIENRISMLVQDPRFTENTTL